MACRDCAYFSPPGWGGRDHWNEGHCMWRPDWPEWLVQKLFAERDTQVSESDGDRCKTFASLAMHGGKRLDGSYW